MIYVEENKPDRQIELLELIAADGNMLLCAWLYADEVRTHIGGIPVEYNDSKLEQVSSYNEAADTRRTEVVEATEENIASLHQHMHKLGGIDSIALYIPGEPGWEVAVIGHEHMCIVRDDRYLKMLLRAGFDASENAPEWW